MLVKYNINMSHHLKLFFPTLSNSNSLLNFLSSHTGLVTSLNSLDEQNIDLSFEPVITCDNQSNKKMFEWGRRMMKNNQSMLRPFSQHLGWISEQD